MAPTRTLTLKRLIYGFHNPDLGLGPVNFCETEHKVQAIVEEPNALGASRVIAIAEFDALGGPAGVKKAEAAARRWSRLNGARTAGVPVRVLFGGAFAR